jgi:hypothetical protein
VVAAIGTTRRCALCNEHSRPLVAELETWLRKQRAKLSAKNKVAKAIAASISGAASSVSSMTAACACPTTPPSGRCAASQSAAAT